jgi:mono/diheme cytochrome c family protein
MQFKSSLALRILLGIGLAPVFSVPLSYAIMAQNQPPSSSQDPDQRSVWDGVYTDKQAQRGYALYGPKCLNCHGDDLEGDIVEHPALAGGEFMWKWNGATLEPIFERIHRDMPMKNAGTLSRGQSADLLAYILRENHFPVGQQDLPDEPVALRQIRFEAVRPEPKPAPKPDARR